MSDRRVRDITLTESQWATVDDHWMVEIRIGGASYRDLTTAECRELAYQLVEAARSVDAAYMVAEAAVAAMSGWDHWHADPREGEQPEEAPAPRMEPTAREAAMRRMEASTEMSVRSMAAALRALDVSLGPTCDHGVDMRAGCGTCLTDNDIRGMR